jgi:hypothetical protein
VEREEETMSTRVLLVVVALALGAAFVALPVSAADPEIVRIGVMETLFQDTSPAVRESFAPEFSKLAKDFTGFKCVTLQGLNPFTAAKQLDTGKWHLGVFQGVEFAWLQGKYPKLKPLMVVIFQEPKVRALLVTKESGAIKGFANLKGQEVNILQTKLHCRLFADKGAGGKAQGFFSKIWQVRSAEDTLDELVRGKVKAAVVDTPSLDYYKNLQPGRFKTLKIVAQSDVFPETAVLYKEGALSDGMLKKFREGMLKANKSEKGRQVMSDFRITSFQPVPDDYQKYLTSILKAYPGPRQ